MKKYSVHLILFFSLASCQFKAQDSMANDGLSRTQDEFVVDYLQNAFTYSFKDISQKKVRILNSLSDELKQEKLMEFDKLIPKIEKGKISQVGSLKSVSKISRQAYLGDLEIAILEDASVNRFWIQVKIELETQDNSYKIEKLSIEAKKQKTDFPAKLALQEKREIALQVPCTLFSVDASAWPQSEIILQSQQQIKLQLGKGGDGEIKLTCADQKFLVPIAQGSSFEHIFYRIDEEWIFVEPKLSKDKASTVKSLDNIKQSIEKELGFSFK